MGKTLGLNRTGLNRICHNYLIFLRLIKSRQAWAKIFGSGALPGFILDLGLLIISLLVFFPISSPCGGLLPCRALSKPLC